ncbi:deoxyribodipyrimidine photo-lyase [soil metagenome]
MEKINIFWFRRDLRIEDNTGLYHSFQEDLHVLPLFIFDSEILDELPDRKDARVNFIYNQISILYKQFKGAFLIKYGIPLDVIKQVIAEYPVSTVFANHDYEPYAIKRDSEVSDFLNSNGVRFHTFKDQVIFEKNEVVSPSGDPYKIFTPYKKRWLQHLDQKKLQNYNSSEIINHTKNIDPLPFPSLKDLNFDKSEIPVPDLNVKDELIRKYSEARNFPAQNGTSRLGIHLRFGTVSIRKLVSRAWQLNETWLNELIWREFYMMVLFHNPQVVNKAFKAKFDRIPWRNNREDFEKWCQGTTGYPLVDAGMREMNATGFMHNRVRMVAASFLTKHLLIDWRWGEAYFAQKLLDYELSSNNGGWQWAAGTGTDAQPYFRIFNPTTQAQKFDPHNVYINKWIPEINTDSYPEPIIEHNSARERALSLFKKVLNK